MDYLDYIDIEETFDPDGYDEEELEIILDSI